MVQEVLKTQTTPLLLAEELLSYRAENDLATASSKYMYGPSKFSRRCPLWLCDNGFTPGRETSGETQIFDAIFPQTAGEPGRSPLNWALTAPTEFSFSLSCIVMLCCTMQMTCFTSGF